MASRESNQQDWTYGVFGCFGNPVLCIATFVVPCVTFGLTVDDFSEKNCCLYGWLYLVPGLNCYLQTQQREEIRNKRAIPGTFLNDFSWVFVCTLCTLVQQTREIVEMKGEEAELENTLSKTQHLPTGHHPHPHHHQPSRYVPDPTTGVRTTQPRPSRSPYTIDISPPTKGTDEIQKEKNLQNDYDEPAEPRLNHDYDEPAETRLHHEYDDPLEPGRRSAAGYANMKYQDDDDNPESRTNNRPAGNKDSFYYDMNRPSMYVASDANQRPEQGEYVNDAYDYEPVNVQDVSYNVV